MNGFLFHNLLSVILCLVLCLGSLTQLSAQQERITNYDVLIEIQNDRSIIVTENISVYAAGTRIKRGITRSLPKTRNFQGKRRAMQYKIMSVRNF